MWCRSVVNFSSVLCLATCRMRSSPCDTVARFCARSVLCWLAFPRPLPLAPPTPRRIAPRRSPASQLLRRGLTSHARASSATAPHLPDAGLGGRPVHRPNVRPPRFRRGPFVRDVFFDHGRASVPRITGPHMLPSTLLTGSAPSGFLFSALNSTPHTIAVYALHPPSPPTPQHRPPGAPQGPPRTGP